MEATADRIRSVVKTILPERPHHLSLYPDHKYPVPPDYWHHQSPLQYSTYLSDADRGVLLTRPYFDIYDEPTTNTPAPAPAPKKMTKMSFKDYQKAKKAPKSPMENGGGTVSIKVEERGHATGANKTERDALRRDHDRHGETGALRDSRAREGPLNGDLERSRNLTSKPHSRDALSPLESKKRPSDIDDAPRPHKKAKASEDLTRRPPRPETPRTSAPDRAAGKDGRSGAAHSTPGNRATTGGSREKDRAVSPLVTINGAKNSNSSSSNALPRKPDTSGKHLVPPLLSPLRHPAIDDELDTTTPKKKLKDGNLSSKAQAKPAKPEVSSKKKSALPELPALLSPTLPAMVEDELLRLDKALHRGDLGPPLSPEASKSATRKDKTKETVVEESKAKSLIVTLKVKKASRPNLRRLLALPSKNRKDRSVSVENTPPPAKKRPRPAEATAEVVAAPPAAIKRPKAPEIPASKTPYTPPNPPAPALPGAASSGSQNPTPSGRSAQTPGAKETIGSRGGSAKDRDALLQRHATMSNLGRTLKRERDREKQRQPNGGPPADDYRPVLLTMEMILAYIIAFRSQNQACEVSRTHVDEKAWFTLEPHFKELRFMTHHSLPLHTLAIQLNGILINEILKVHAFNGNPTREPRLEEASHKILLRYVSHQFSVWSEVERLRGRLADDKLKTPVMGPWTSTYKAAADTLSVMARVAEREHINWKAEVVPPKE
ncbi:hypothetical protein BD289DRAFT_291388 [Coniella lustricola]|uniref:Uncharacterized protein n=1 Tax=Coniella lustricola TaxID=2025994 RepID=A0A2T3A572_9PEZI|nr:hypothetical protein BD289DRAFT_291388 [Coniella lustricola]